MTSRTWSRTPITLSLALAILCTYTMVALAAPQGQAGPTGDLSVVGEVSVNGTSAISGATVFSDSTIATGQNSSAVVSLGKLGRVELLPNSSLKLRDRKSTRLNSSHDQNIVCRLLLEKKKQRSRYHY